MGALLSVEINTWFLIMRRILHKSRGSGQQSPVLVKLVSICFYVSWIVIRVFLYPAIMVQYLLYAHEAIVETGRYFHTPMVCIPVHFALCVLNIKWTYDLFKPIVKEWVSPSGKSSAVSSGL